VEIYRHTQRGTVIIASMSAAIALAAAILATIVATEVEPLAPACISAFVLALLVACLFAFGSLTVTVDPTGVAAAFGPGLFRRRIATSSIRAARAVRNGWHLGWGIRWVPRGWMYNVSGLDAVELELDTGRVFRIGTDEPARLLAAIESALAGLRRA
jgi:hypothetical protein